MISKIRSLLGSTSPKVFLIVIVTLNSILMTMAFAFLCYEVYQKQELNKSSPVDKRSSAVLEGTVGFIDVGICILGIVGAVMKKRNILVAAVALMFLSMLSNIFLCVAHSISSNVFQIAYRDVMSRKLIAHYGNNSDPFSREFTFYIDNQHKKYGCCGWSGEDGAKNFFLETPWYQQMNANAKGEPQTLPDSCCIEPNDECRRATNVKAARESGVVYQEDCVDLYAGRVGVYHTIMIIQLSVYIVLQIASMVVTVLNVIVLGSQTA